MRDYGTAQWDGGDAACEHTQANPSAEHEKNRQRALNKGYQGHGGWEGRAWRGDGGSLVCGKCGARRIDRQIGLEASPDLWLTKMVAVFREVRRVLRPDGTLWLNIGDAYANGGGEKRDRGHGFVDGGKAKLEAAKGAVLSNRWSDPVLKPKDLMLMPARLALALQADGWWVRSDIIWAKPNPMPESCTDRPTSSYEHVFLLTRSARYYYDADAVREEHAEPGRLQVNSGRRYDGFAGNAQCRAFPAGDERGYNPAGRNQRNVWTIPTEAFPGSHFATYPTELVSRCIRAGTSERGCCAACGAPWVRETERHSHVQHQMPERSLVTGATRNALGGQKEWDAYVAPTTTGWSPSCRCDAGDTVPATVLDPFGGAGTTGLVAHRLQRNAVLIELNPAYAEMARQRITTDAPLFTSWPPVATDAQDERMADLFAMAAD